MKKVLPLSIFMFLLASFVYSDCSTLDLLDEGLGPWTRNVAGSHQLSASGGTAPYTFSVSSGAFAPGVSMNSSGLISGTPTGCDQNGYFVCILLTDSVGCHQTTCYYQFVNC